LREKIRVDPLWYFHSMGKPAPWIDGKMLAEQQRLLPPKEYSRLWENVWVTAAGAEWPDSYFPESIYFTDWPDKLLVKVVALDPTQGKTAKPGDYAAFATVGVDRSSRIWADCEMHLAWTTTQQAERLVSLYQEQRAMAAGVESVLFQSLIKQDVDRIARTAGIPIQSYGIPNTAPKPTRIVGLTPYLSQGTVRVKDTPGGRLLVAQLKAFSMKAASGVHDDGPDALEQGVRLIRYLLGERKMRDAPTA
jgi:predicted phage terminase large subunit-like protein